MTQQAGFLSKLGLSEDDAKLAVLSGTQAFSAGATKVNSIGMAQITSQYAADSDKRRAQGDRTKLDKDKAAVNAAALTRTMATQVDAMNAQGAQQVAAATSGITGTSMKDISSAMAMEEDIRIQNIITQTEAQRYNINKQQQTIDYQMKVAEVVRKGQAKAASRSRGMAAFNTVLQIGMSAYMGATAAGNQTGGTQDFSKVGGQSAGLPTWAPNN